MVKLEKRYNVWFVKNLGGSMGIEPKTSNFVKSFTNFFYRRLLSAQFLIVMCQNLYLVLNKYYFEKRG